MIEVEGKREEPYVRHVSADEEWSAPSLSYRVLEEVDIILRPRCSRVPRITKIVATIQEKEQQ